MMDFIVSILSIYSRIVKKMRGSSVRHSAVDKTSVVEAGSNVVNSVIQRHTFFGYDCTVVNADVGSFCSIASSVRIGGVAHPMHFVSTSPVFLSHKDSVKKKYAHHDYLPVVRTSIGHDVWIGDGAFIKSGVIIGTGAVVGMGAVVTKDVAPYSIVAGNPAVHIRFRFEKDIVDRFLKSEWWLLNDKELSNLGEIINDPEQFLIELEKL